MKKIWKENKVLCMLVFVLIVCFIAIVAVALTFFYSKDANKYGTRLDGIENYPITEELKSSYIEEMKKNESVKEISFNIVGRVVYVHINFDEKIKLESAQNLVIKNLDMFGEDNLGYYDINFVLKSDNFTMYGAKNAVAEMVSWNNNTEVKEETDEES